ncbi:type I polyketide synthase, partial [Streptomyces microflavus]|uniref:type I polyketide synthase n=1 Tax=Streptomyces microflavus TaxID=1919 RepID=UPI00369D3196
GVVETLEEATGAPAIVSGTLRRDDGGLRRFLLSAAELHVHGIPIDWVRLLPAGGVPAASGLPTYPFQHQRYWLAPGPAATTDATGLGLAPAVHPLLGAVVELPNRETVFTGRLGTRSHSWLLDHSVSGTVLLPGAVFLELALRAGEEVGLARVDELVVEAPLVLPDPGGVQLRVTVDPPAVDGRRAAHVYARPEDTDSGEAWTRHATGFLGAESAPEFGYEAWPPPGAELLATESFYDDLAAAGYEYGETFRGLKSAWRLGDEVFAEVVLAGQLDDTHDRFGLHPALLDAALQSANLGAAPTGRSGEVLLPFAWNDVSLYASGATALRVHARRVAADGVSFTLSDPTGRPVAAIGTLVLRPVALDRLSPAADPAAEHLYRVDLAPLDLPRTVTAASAPHVFDLTDRSGASTPQSVRDAVEATRLRVQDHLSAAADRPLAILTGDPVGDLVAGAVWGLVRSVQLEHPGRVVLVGSDEGPTVEGLAARVVACGEPQVVWQGGAAWVPRLVRVDEPGVAGVPGVPGVAVSGGSFDPEGTVLVTGGTGTLGSLVARHLVAVHGVRHLVLVSRSGLGAAGAEALLADLTRAGARVDIVAADVSDREVLAGVLAGVDADHPLTGVVHTAGALADGVFDALTAGQVATAFGPKADAAWHLHELTRDLGLGAFVLFSSGAGIFGNPGQSAYGAANGYLDALARYRRERGLPAHSLAWGLWAEASGLTGHLDGRALDRLAEEGLQGLTTDEALALFDAALGSSEPVLVPTRLDYQALRAQAADGQLNPLLRGLVRTPRRTAATAPDDSAGHEALLDRLAVVGADEQLRLLVEVVRGSAASVLGQRVDETVRADQTFKEVGFDSLTALRIRNGLTQATGVRLPATLIFDHPTPASVAEHVRDRLGLVDAAASVTPELLELDRLEKALGDSARASDELRVRISGRLEALTARWAVTVREADGVSVDSASDDELFDLIDNELGLQ